MVSDGFRKPYQTEPTGPGSETVVIAKIDAYGVPLMDTANVATDTHDEGNVLGFLEKVNREKTKKSLTSVVKFAIIVQLGVVYLVAILLTVIALQP